MKKHISLMIVLLLMGYFLIPTVENVANASDLTAQQKFEQLQIKGIFSGINGGESGLDQNMNRAQFARVAALLLNLEGIGTPDTKVVTEKPFKDVELGAWYVEEIAAAKEAGIMLGSPDGTFSPSKDMTVQEMAVATARVLDIEPEKDANVEGAADWAAGYIQALKKQNIDFPTNYKETATRSDLVSAAFELETVITDKKETEKKAEELKKAEEEKKKQEESWYPPSTPFANTTLSILDAKAVGAKKFQVRFNRSIDPAAIRLSFSKNGSPIDFQAVPDNETRNYTLTLAEKLTEGIYTVTASYTDSSAVIGSVNVIVMDERVVKLSFVNPSDTVAKGTRIGIEVLVQNQYGESMSMPNLSKLEVLSSGATATIASDRPIVVVDTSSESLQSGISNISITVHDTDSHVSVTKNFRVESMPFVSKAAFIGSLRGIDGQEVSQAHWSHTYHMNLDLYDQYGHMILYPLPSGSGSIASILDPYSANISVGSLIEAPAGEPGTFSLPITLATSESANSSTYTLSLRAGDGSATHTFQVAGSPVLQTLATPTANPASGAVVSGTQVSLSATSGTTIYYTVDGSTPTTSSVPYTGPINITSSTTVKAIAVQPGWTNSSVASFVYAVTIPIELPELIQSSSLLIAGNVYTGSVAASGGTGAITYAITSGQLPAGLDLDEYAGVISGTPSVSGTFNFTISATDSATTPATASAPYTMTIVAPAPTLTHLTSNPANVMLTAVGTTEALAITASFDDAQSLNVTDVAQYASNNVSVATVNDAGIVTAVASGTTTIVVTYGSLTLNVPVMVTESRQLAFLNASIASYGLRVGATTNLTVNVLFNDDTAEDVTAWATFEIENPELATIDANGILTALKPGSTKIIVKFLSMEYIIEGILIQ
ncbi:MAG: chitobiase/beta-hexosaminidase C-terminal domain-containing protein [Candidatus Pristimantibacillus lignocellulolyticus]|uniref:Chitobiase/beta-hexosaminidase C-terminal domain-containing protein n=1 Tax=Candidatus Pristimantibacillus lignocellulolyticus TaxID=2994561 RepID=A0A9J6ZK89_9BACL|nr:MAG: chitobiase/beta-hexosaminidase C-terminal domain-containing protein [Candidatus Pristimantibacillus lignocellulolyticus]